MPRRFPYRPKAVVKPGDKVAAGDSLFKDKATGLIRLTSCGGRNRGGNQTWRTSAHSIHQYLERIRI